MSKHRRPTRTESAIESITRPDAVESRAWFWDSQGAKGCAVCGFYVPREPRSLALAPWRHWIVPKAEGGLAHPRNIELAHSCCSAVFLDCYPAIPEASMRILKGAVLKALREEPEGSEARAHGETAWRRYINEP